MSADPIQSPAPAAIAYLEPVPARPEPAPDVVEGLRKRLEIERSAGKAVLAAMRELESRLVSEREQLAAMTAQNQTLQEELAREQATSEGRYHEVKALWSELTATTATLQFERSKPVWKRLFSSS